MKLNNQKGILSPPILMSGGVDTSKILESNPKALADGGYIKNHFRFKKIDEGYLLTTDHGSWIILNKRDYRKFIINDLDGSLFEALERKGLIITKRNINTILKEHHQRIKNVFNGTSLHILTPTIRCNQKCGYCHSNVKSQLSNKEYDMSKKTVRKTLEFIFQTPQKNITIEFQGGETLLRSDLFKYTIEEGKKMNKKHNKNIRFSLVSNLTLMTDELLDWITKEGVEICTSLDGPKELHDKNRWFEGGGASYDEVTYWIKKIKKKVGHPPGMLMVTTKNSIPLWKEIIDEYVKWGMNSLQLKHMNKIGFAKLSWKQIGYDLDEFLDFWKKGVDYMIELNKRGVRIRERFTTLILQKILTKDNPNFVDWINPTGEIIGVMAYDHKGDIFSSDEGRMEPLFKLGNVHKDNYAGIISSEKAQQIIGSSMNDNYIMCDACVYKPWCGIDPVMVYSEQETPIPKISEWSKHKVYEFQFDYVFKKLLYDKEAARIFESWLNNWGDKNSLIRRELFKIINIIYGMSNAEIGWIRGGDFNLTSLIRVGENKKILKVYPRWFQDKKKDLFFVRSVIDWASFLYKSRFPIGKIELTEGNESYFDMDKKFGTIQEYIEGEKFVGADIEIKNASDSLAKMHLILRDYKKEFPREFENEGGGLKRNIFKSLSSDVVASDVVFESVKKKYGKFIDKTLVKLQKSLNEKEFKNLERLVIHGDYNVNNIIYKKQKVVGIIDFDTIVSGPKIYDLAVFFCSLMQYWWGDLMTKIPLAYNAYTERIKLTEYEKKMIIPLMRLHFLKQIYAKMIFSSKEKGIKEVIDSLNRLDNNAKKIQKYLK